MAVKRSDVDPLKRLEEMEAAALKGGGDERIARQHQAGKLTARERIELLFDPGTFVEVDKFVTHRSIDFGMAKQKILGDGAVSRDGTIQGPPGVCFPPDVHVVRGS